MSNNLRAGISIVGNFRSSNKVEAALRRPSCSGAGSVSCWCGAITAAARSGPRVTRLKNEEE
jgi:hypothetical protein